MRREEIRELAIERVAQHDWSEGGSTAISPTWEALPTIQADVWRRNATRTVDALGDLLPTGVEDRNWVAYHEEWVPEFTRTETVTPMRRYVTDYRPIGEKP